MKKFFLSLVALCTMVGVQAQNEQATATLQHGSDVSVFTGVSAFIDANAAAVDGDVITLSSGVFNTANIVKAISVYGTGFEKDATTNTDVTKINGQLYLGVSEGTKITGLHLEGIYFNSHVITNVPLDQFTIGKCYINGNLKIGENTASMVQNCVITGNIEGTTATNCLIENSWIGGNINSFSASSTIKIDHCIVCTYVGPYSCYNSIFPYYWVGAYYDRAVFANTEGALAVNCIFRSFSYNNQDKNDFQNCYAVDIKEIFSDAENSGYTPTRTYEIKHPETWIATDGTEIGIRGGSGWTKVPTTPVVKNLQLNVSGKTLNVTYETETR